MDDPDTDESMVDAKTDKYDSKEAEAIGRAAALARAAEETAANSAALAEQRWTVLHAAADLRSSHR